MQQLKEIKSVEAIARKMELPEETVENVICLFLSNLATGLDEVIQKDKKDNGELKSLHDSAKIGVIPADEDDFSIVYCFKRDYQQVINAYNVVIELVQSQGIDALNCHLEHHKFDADYKIHQK